MPTAALAAPVVAVAAPSGAPAAAPSAPLPLPPAARLEDELRVRITAQLPSDVGLVAITMPRSLTIDSQPIEVLGLRLPRALAEGRHSATLTARIGRRTRRVLVRFVTASMRDVLVTTRALSISAVIGAGDVMISRRALAAVDAADAATEPVTVIGQRVRRGLDAGALLDAAAIEPQPAVPRGSHVTLEFSRGGLRVHGQGTLERAARIGETAFVRLSASTPPVRGLLIDTTVVRIEVAP